MSSPTESWRIVSRVPIFRETSYGTISISSGRARNLLGLSIKMPTRFRIDEINGCASVTYVPLGNTKCAARKTH